MITTRGEIDVKAAGITVEQFAKLLSENRSLREIHALDYIYGEICPDLNNPIDVVTIKPYNAVIRIITITVDSNKAYVCYDILDGHYKDMIIDMDLYGLKLVPRVVFNDKVPTRLITIDVSKPRES